MLFVVSSYGSSRFYLRRIFSVVQENTTTIVFRMFDKVLAPELIPSVLEKFIRVYMREHDLQEEELLLLYIEVTFPVELVSVCAQGLPLALGLCWGSTAWVSYG